MMCDTSIVTSPHNLNANPQSPYIKRGQGERFQASLSSSTTYFVHRDTMKHQLAAATETSHLPSNPARTSTRSKHQVLDPQTTTMQPKLHPTAHRPVSIGDGGPEMTILASGSSSSRTIQPPCDPGTRTISVPSGTKNATPSATSP